MTCIPFVRPTPGPFINREQAAWSSHDETRSRRSCRYEFGNLAVTASDGRVLPFNATGGGQVRHQFFGTGDFLAVLTSGPGVTSTSHVVLIVDFTATPIAARTVLRIEGSGGSLPSLQYSQGTGSLCLVAGAVDGGTAGIGVFRSDTGALVCAGPPTFDAGMSQIIAEAETNGVRIVHAGRTIGGPCPYPASNLQAQPARQSFDRVRLAGCPERPSIKRFVLTNTGNDCLIVERIADRYPYSVTAVTPPLPATLEPMGRTTLAVTVTFSPAATGRFDNVELAITATPATGADKLICSGVAVMAEPGFTCPDRLGFERVPVGTPHVEGLAIRNTGGVPIAFTVRASEAMDAPFAWEAWSDSLTCGASHSVSVTFTPEAAGLAPEATVTVEASPGGSRTVALGGEGCVPTPRIVVPPSPFPAFGNVRRGYRLSRRAIVHNGGSDTLTFHASISGPDEAMFGLVQGSGSLTDVVRWRRDYFVLPRERCGDGPMGDGRQEVVVVFHANGPPGHHATAYLSIYNHNDPAGPATSTNYVLEADVIEGNTLDVVAVFDTSGSMGDPVAGGGTKMAAAIEAGRLLVQLIPPDLGNRIAGTRFSTTASTFLPIDGVTAANRDEKALAIADPPLAPDGSTAIAAGAMVGLVEFDSARSGTAPANLVRAMIVLTDGMDNTAYRNPVDGELYTISAIPAFLPEFPLALVGTRAFVPPPSVKVYGVGFGTGVNIDLGELAALSSGADGYFQSVDPTQPAARYELMKYYTLIYMDMFDMAAVRDPKYRIAAGEWQAIEFNLLRGDVGAMVVIYDFDGLRLPFCLITPAGWLIDANYYPPGFQLRSGYTDTSRFIEFLLPPGDPESYAGTWKVVVAHPGYVYLGAPDPPGHAPPSPETVPASPGFIPREMGRFDKQVEYGIAIGAGSNFRLEAYLTPAPVKVGEPILMTGVPTEAGLPVLGCTLEVEARAPNGESRTFTLSDDGAHQDGDAGDGEYARLYTGTAMAGSYSFTFRAIGFSRDGELVHREVVRAKYVDGPGSAPHPTGDKDDDCCRQILEALDRQSRLLAKLAAAAAEAQRLW